MVKSAKKTSNLDLKTDFDFVTFLRNILSLKQEIDILSDTPDRSISCVEWVDQYQSIFRINNREQFAMKWYSSKVTGDINCLIIILFVVQGLSPATWKSLHGFVITETFSNSFLVLPLFIKCFV